MNNKESIINLKKSLENIYNNFRERIDTKEWKRVISRAYKDDPFQASVIVINFTQTHYLIPASVWRAICNAINLRDNPTMMANIFSEKIIRQLYYNMVNHEPIRYSYIPADKTEAELKEIIELAEMASIHLDKGQIYLAGKDLEILKEHCPTHPDVLEMQNRYSELKINGGININEFRKQDSLIQKARRGKMNIGANLIKEGKLKEAVEFYEDLVKDDYNNYAAYYTLGGLYLQVRETEKADYMAGFLMDLNKEPANAMMLKGMVLEKREKFADALFYYSEVYNLNRSETAADKCRLLTARLESERAARRRNKQATVSDRAAYAAVKKENAEKAVKEESPGSGKKTQGNENQVKQEDLKQNLENSPVEDGGSLADADMDKTENSISTKEVNTVEAEAGSSADVQGGSHEAEAGSSADVQGGSQEAEAGSSADIPGGFHDTEAGSSADMPGGSGEAEAGSSADMPGGSQETKADGSAALPDSPRHREAVDSADEIGSDNADEIGAAIEAPTVDIVHAPDPEDLLKLLYMADKPGEESRAKTVPKVSEKILMIAEGAEESIRRGRFSQAYYELRKKSSSYSDSSLLKYQKAFVLYLMNREAESRILLNEIDESDYLYEKAAYLIEDIDINISENDRFEDVPQEILAEVLFNTGRYQESLRMFRRIDNSRMTAKAWSLRGRCEIKENHLNEALRSLNKAYHIQPDVSYVRDLIGMIYQVKGDNLNALRMYDEAIRTGSDPIKACEMKASLLYAQERNEELLAFRNDVEMSLGQGSDVDGYAGMIHLTGYPRNEEKGLIYLERAINAGTERLEFYITAINECIKRGNLTKALMFTEGGLSLIEGSDTLYMKKAEILYLSGKLHAAELIAGMLLTDRPDSAEIQYLIGKINASRGEDKEAVRWFQSAAQIDQSNHKYAYALADKCFEMDDMVTAVEYYTKAINLDKMDFISYKRRAMIYSRINEDELALNDINCAMLLKPEDPEVYVIIGNILSGYEVEEFEDSDELSVPARVSVHDMEEETAEKDEETENAAAETGEESRDENPEELSDTVDHDGEKDKADDSRKKDEADSRTKDKMKREEDSRSNDLMHDLEKDSEYYYTKALTLNPQYREGYVCRAKFYAEKNRIEPALADIEKAIALDEWQSDSYMVRGIIYHIAGENKKAVSDFEKVLRIDSRNLQAYSYIAKCYNELGMYDEAIETAERGIAVNPEFLNLYVNRGVAYFNLLKYNQAIEDFRLIIMKKNTINTAAVESAYKFRGFTYEKMKKYVEAASDYRMFLKYNPDNVEVKTRLSVVEGYLAPEKTKVRSKFTLFRRSK